MFDAFIGKERPLGWVLRFWPVLVAAFISALAATSLCQKVALRFGLVDRPDHRVKTNQEPIVCLLIITGSALFVWHKGYLRMRGPRGVAPGKEKASVPSEV